MLKLSSLRSKKSPREASGWTCAPAWTTEVTTVTTDGPPPRAGTPSLPGPGPAPARPAVTGPTCLSTLRTTAAAAPESGELPAWGPAPGLSGRVPWDSGPGSLARPPHPGAVRELTAPARRTEHRSQQGRSQLTVSVSWWRKINQCDVITILVQDEI